MLLPSLELTILIINFLSTNLKNCIKNTANGELLKAFNDKKNTPRYMTSK